MSHEVVIDQRFGSASELCRVLQARCWRRRPVVIRDVLELGPGTAADALAGLRVRARDHRPSAVYADDRLLRPAEVHRCVAADTSIVDYAKRLKAELQSERIACIATGFETTTRGVWQRSIRFLTALHEAVGVPAGDAALELVLSSDGTRPGERAPHDTLTWVLAGRQRHVVGTTPCDAGPGDLVYRPWDHEHRIESAGGFAATLVLAIAPSRSRLAGLEAVTAAAAHVYRFEPFVSGAQPDVVRERVAAILDAVSDAATRDALRDEHLNRTTRRGFRAPLPPAAALELRDDDVLAPPSANLIAWQRRSDQLVVSVNGHAFGVDPAPAVVELLATLNAGAPHRVADLAARFCAPGLLERDELDAILGCLFTFHAFEVANVRAELFPAGLAEQATALELAIVPEQQHRVSRGFVAGDRRMSVAQVRELIAREPAARARYVVSGFACEAARLRRCVDAIEGCYAIAEPAVLDDAALWAATGADRDDMRRLLQVLAALLFRSEGAAPVVFTAPEYATTLLEDLLDAGADSAAVFLHAPLASTIAGALASEPMRVAARRLVRSPAWLAAARPLGVPEVDAGALSDAQAIAYAWLTDRARYVAQRPRIRALDLDRWLADPARGIRAVADHLDLGLATGRELQIAQSKIFRTYSESLRAELPYDASARAREVANHLQSHGPAVEAALRWCSELWGSHPPETFPHDLLAGGG